MTVGVTEHMPDVLQEQWAVLTYQHGCYDGCQEAVCFNSEDDANRYAQTWASDIGHSDETEHEIVVMKAVRVLRGRRTWADL